MATIALLGTMDTKGAEYGWVKQELAALGDDSIVIDCGIFEPALTPDITAAEVAVAGGTTLERLHEGGDRGAAVQAMTAGAARVLEGLVRDQRIDGVLALGGSGGSALAGGAVHDLPIGFPKLLVSTMASGDVSPYVGTTDLTLMYSVVDVAGVNRISRLVLGNAAAAIHGMASSGRRVDAAASPSERPLVAASMFGVTTAGVTEARRRLEELGYEVVVFHATGSGGRSMERLIRSGFFAGVLDLTTTELADELVGGVLSAGPDRLEAAGSSGVPQVVSLGALDMVNFGAADTVPPRFAERNLYVHNQSITLMRTTSAEMQRLGTLIGEKLSAAVGPTTLFIPLGGLSAIDVPDGPFYDAVADAALVDAIRGSVEDSVQLVTKDAHINEPAFARAAAEELDRLITQSQVHQERSS